MLPPRLARGIGHCLWMNSFVLGLRNACVETKRFIKRKEWYVFFKMSACCVFGCSDETQHTCPACVCIGMSLLGTILPAFFRKSFCSCSFFLLLRLKGRREGTCIFGILLLVTSGVLVVQQQQEDDVGRVRASRLGFF